MWRCATSPSSGVFDLLQFWYDLWRRLQFLLLHFRLMCVTRPSAFVHLKFCFKFVHFWDRQGLFSSAPPSWAPPPIFSSWSALLPWNARGNDGHGPFDIAMSIFRIHNWICVWIAHRSLEDPNRGNNWTYGNEWISKRTTNFCSLSISSSLDTSLITPSLTPPFEISMFFSLSCFFASSVHCSSFWETTSPATPSIVMRTETVITVKISQNDVAIVSASRCGGSSGVGGHCFKGYAMSMT